MKTTIYLGLHDQFSLKSTRILYLIVGLLLSFNGVMMVIRSQWNLMGLILGILSLIAGIYSVVAGILAFGKNTNFSPNVSISEGVISYKTNVFKRPVHIEADEIKGVEFGQYLVRFKLNKQEKSFSYTANPEVSVRVKEAVRTWCNDYNIEIEGG